MPYTTLSNKRAAAARWRPCNANCSCSVHAQIDLNAVKTRELRETLEMIDAQTLQDLKTSALVPGQLYQLLVTALKFPRGAAELNSNNIAAVHHEVAKVLEALYGAAAATAARVGKAPGFNFKCENGAVKAHLVFAGFYIDDA